MAGVKRRRLNSRHASNAPQSRNGDHPSNPDLDDASSHSDVSDDNLVAHAAGVSYSRLLGSLSRHNAGRQKRPNKGSDLVPSVDNIIHHDLQPPHSSPANVLGSEDDDNGGTEARGSEKGFKAGPTPDLHLNGDLVEDESDLFDPFEAHFASPDDNELSNRLEAVKNHRWDSKYANTPIGKQTLVSPATNSTSQIPGSVISSLQDMKLKQRLIDPAASLVPNLDATQRKLACEVFNYRDLLFCGRKPENADTLRNLACLHALNHIFKTRDRIIKNSNRLLKGGGEADLQLRDQGFTRPKVLILLETRHACSRYMEIITKLCDPEQQENRKRFEDAFIQTNGTISDDKPRDFRELFEGNDDNEFRLGVKFTRKTIKYFSQFYSSDIIFGSPLGIRRAVKADDPKSIDYDFLSSIEMVIVDQADAMLMQNWEHVDFVFEHLNLQPKEPHDCDFSRVRFWYLEQAARYLRQTIVFSAYLTPELNGLFSAQMQNVAGKMKFVPFYEGAINDVGLEVRQTFSRFRSRSPASDPDERFEHFTSSVIPQLTRHADLPGQGLGIVIFIPSYLDFVRVRNYFSTSQETQNLTFGSLSEYTDLASSRRGRSHFYTGRQSVMLYTGRAHHFRRYRLRGVKQVIMYGLPENPLFYNEIVQCLAGTIAEGKLDPAEASVRALFSRWDSLSLERIVGGKRSERMLNDSDGDTFEFR